VINNSCSINELFTLVPVESVSVLSSGDFRKQEVSLVESTGQPIFMNAETRHVSADVEERIRERAYFFYEERGGVDGYDVEDWFRAEADVLSEIARPEAA
jgi:hypothetical protein